MKRKALRIGLALVVLGALAAIPASTQVSSTDAKSADREGVRLPLLLAVNRLELSTAQMETLRTAIRGVLDERLAVEAKRAAFKDEMIAFHGTAEELDSRVSAWNAEMDAAAAQLREKAAAAVDTVKQTLTMKQGEILLDAFPMLSMRLGMTPAPEAARMGMMRGAVKAVGGAKVEATVVSPAMPKMASPNAVIVTSATGETGCAMMRNGQAAPADAGSPAVGKVATLVERVRDRVAKRLGATQGAATMSDCPMMGSSSAGAPRPMMGSASAGASSPMMGSASAGTPCPMMGAAPAGAPCPMMGTMSVPGDAAAVSGSVTSDDFGTLTISLGEDAREIASTGSAVGPMVTWLEQLLEILELKLAAMQ